jgi:hypothetical protein
MVAAVFIATLFLLLWAAIEYSLTVAYPGR